MFLIPLGLGDDPRSPTYLLQVAQFVPRRVRPPACPSRLLPERQGVAMLRKRYSQEVGSLLLARKSTSGTTIAARSGRF